MNCLFALVCIFIFLSIVMVLLKLLKLEDDAYDRTNSCWKCKHYLHTGFERGKCDLNMFQPKSFFIATQDEDAGHSRLRTCNKWEGFNNG